MRENRTLSIRRTTEVLMVVCKGKYAVCTPKHHLARAMHVFACINKFDAAAPKARGASQNGFLERLDKLLGDKIEKEAGLCGRSQLQGKNNVLPCLVSIFHFDALHATKRDFFSPDCAL